MHGTQGRRLVLSSWVASLLSPRSKGSVISSTGFPEHQWLSSLLGASCLAAGPDPRSHLLIPRPALLTLPITQATPGTDHEALIHPPAAGSQVCSRPDQAP